MYVYVYIYIYIYVYKASPFVLTCVCLKNCQRVMQEFLEVRDGRVLI